MRALWTASTGMTAQQLNVDNIANNLANVNTIGYKKTRAEFKDLLYENLERETIRDGQGKPVNLQIGHGVRAAAINRFFTTGNLEQTGNPTDLAIDGQGFFMVLGPNDEELYTKDGSFKLSVDDDSGRLVTSDGYYVQCDAGDVEFSADVRDITIDESGFITVKNADDELEEIGRLTIITFANPAGLESIGRNFYKETGASGEAMEVDDDGFGGTILQGFLEYSNVQVVEEMVKLIQAQRAYEINSKSIQTSDEMLNIANNLRR